MYAELIMKPKLFLSVFLSALLASSPAFAVLPSNVIVWEVRTPGNDTNGGAFATGAPGTDMSQFDNKNAAGCTACQSATVNISTTDLVAVGTSTVVSATANFSVALVGNLVFVTGAGFTTGWYFVFAFTNSTTIVFDRSPGTGTGGTINIGGALASLAQMNLNMALSTANGAWVKAGTYSTSSTITLATAATNQGPYFVNGYTSTRGDNGKATILALVGLSGGNQFVVNYNSAPNGLVFSNFVVNCGNFGFTRGVNMNTVGVVAKNVIVQDCSDIGFAFNSDSVLCSECTTINTPNNVNASTVADFQGANHTLTCVNCQALGSAENGAIAFKDMCQGTFINPILANFSGTSTTAWTCVTEEAQLVILNASISGFTGDAFQFQLSNTVDQRPLLIRNAVLSAIGGFCFNNLGSRTLPPSNQVSDHNFCKPGSGFYSNWGAGPSDVTLTADPFTNATGNDFSLNATAGGGAAVKGAGFPGVLPNGGGTGHIDGGALQTAGGGGGGSTTHSFGTR